MFKFQTLIERLVTTPVENQLFEANPFQTLIERLVTRRLPGRFKGQR